MKFLFSFISFLLALSAYSQISPDSSRKEQERIMNLSRYQSIDYFATARALKVPAKKGDAIVLQDEESKLYFGIIDSVRSFTSIRIILYPKPNKRELVQATYDDLHYLKPVADAAKPAAAEPVEVQSDIKSGDQLPVSKSMEDAVEKAVSSAMVKIMNRPSGNNYPMRSELEERLEKLEKNLAQREYRMNEAAYNFEEAGKYYETAEILRIVSYASLFLGSVVNVAATVGSGSSSNLAAGGLLYLASGVTGIGAIVYRFKGHSKVKTGGMLLRR